MSSVQLSGAGVAAVAFTNKGLASPPSALRVCSSRRSVRSLVVRAATVVTPKVCDRDPRLWFAICTRLLAEHYMICFICFGRIECRLYLCMVCSIEFNMLLYRSTLH
jgi:hypothetical protein